VLSNKTLTSALLVPFSLSRKVISARIIFSFKSTKHRLRYCLFPALWAQHTGLSSVWSPPHFQVHIPQHGMSLSLNITDLTKRKNWPYQVWISFSYTSRIWTHNIDLGNVILVPADNPSPGTRSLELGQGSTTRRVEVTVGVKRGKCSVHRESNPRTQPRAMRTGF
jgi:hypothetical protein